MHTCVKLFNSMNGDVGIYHVKIVGARSRLSNTIKDTGTIVRNPLP